MTESSRRDRSRSKKYNTPPPVTAINDSDFHPTGPPDPEALDIARGRPAQRAISGGVEPTAFAWWVAMGADGASPARAAAPTRAGADSPRDRCGANGEATSAPSERREDEGDAPAARRAASAAAAAARDRIRDAMIDTRAGPPPSSRGDVCVGRRRKRTRPSERSRSRRANRESTSDVTDARVSRMRRVRRRARGVARTPRRSGFSEGDVTKSRDEIALCVGRCVVRRCALWRAFGLALHKRARYERVVAPSSLSRPKRLVPVRFRNRFRASARPRVFVISTAP